MAKAKIHPTHLYAQRVISGEIKANKWIILACQRHLDDLKRTDIWFDEVAATRFFNYCRLLRHYKGPERGKRMRLNLWQKFAWGNVYGWKRVVDGVKTDVWRFNIIYIEIPRKNGKTTVGAAGASYDASCVEGTGAEVYCLATKEDQAKLLVNDVCAYIAQSESLQSEFEILKGQNTVYTKASSRTSFIRPLGSDSKRLDGLNPLSAYADELHAWPKRDLWDVIEDAFGARKNWHMVAITTAGVYNPEGICWKERSHAIDILEGRVKADNKFGLIYTVDDKEKKNWRDPANWYISNPNLGSGKEYDYMVHKSTKAEQIPSELNTFLTKQLNIWTDVAEAWLSTEDWKEGKKEFSEELLYGKTCCAGLDLAEVNDLSAVAYMFEPQVGLDVWHLLIDYYMPKGMLRKKSDRDGVSYENWVEAKHITATPGIVTDFNFIEHDILKRKIQFKIKQLGFDPFKSTQIITNLRDKGVKCLEHRQGYISMGPPTAATERLVCGKQIKHQGDPVTEWCVVNTIVRTDPAGLKKPDKEEAQKMKKRIDGVVAAIMARGAYDLKDKDEKPESPYEKKKLRVI